MRIRRLLIPAILAILCLGALPGLSVADTSFSHCIQKTNGLFNPTNDCQLPYADGGQIISPIDTCRHPSSIAGLGDLTDPGKDYLLETNLVSLGRTGKVSAPQNISVNATVSAECQRYSSAYQLSGKIISPDGTSYPINFGAGVFTEGYQDLIVTDYCFLELNPMCGYIDYQGTVSIPSSATTGLYSVSMTVSPGAGSISGLSPLTENFSSIVDVSGVAPSMPSPAPTPSVSPTSSPNPQVAVVAPQFSLSMVGTTLDISVSTESDNLFLEQYPGGRLIARVTTPSGGVVNSDPAGLQIQRGSGATFTVTNATPGVWIVQLAGVLNGTQGDFSSPQSFVVPVPAQGQVPTSVPSPVLSKSPTPKSTSKPKISKTSSGPKPTPTPAKSPIKPIPAPTLNPAAKKALNRIFQFMPDLLSSLKVAGVNCTSYVKNTTSTLGTREEGDCKWNKQDLTVDIYAGNAQSTKKLLDTLSSSGLVGGYTLYLQNWSINLSDGPTAKLIMKLTGASLE